MSNHSEGGALGGLTTPRAAANTPRAAGLPVPRSPEWRRGIGARRRRRGFGKRLQHVKEIAARLPVVGSAYAYASPSVSPDLKVWAVPQHGEAQLSRTGLVSTREFAKPVRNGLSGLSVFGKKQIRHAAKLLEDIRSRTAFWTINLPDSDYRHLLTTGKWNEFQTRTRDLLVRELKQAGDEAVVIQVCEIGPERLRSTGLPCPHIHCLTTGWGRKHPDGRYVLCKEVMDQLVAKAAQYVGLPSTERSAASQIQGVKHSVGSYMSKYLTKAQAVDLSEIPKEHWNLIPHQWWNQSASCKALVDGHLFKLPPAFASFVVRQAILLERLELGKGGVRTVGYKKTKLAELPIEVFCFKFTSPEALHQAMEMFCLWVVQGEPDRMVGVDLSG